MAKRLLFSVTKDDCDWQTFRAGGAGGQNQNKVESGVRCIHRASGARAKARDTRDQLKNRRAAFVWMLATPEFKAWHKLECARRMGKKSPEQIVEEQMESYNLRVEQHTEEGWVPFKVDNLSTQ